MQLNGARIAVTGATGFLGRYIVDTLLDRGSHVVGVVRNPDRVPALAEKGVELRRADLAEPDRLAAGFTGVDAVVSNAALFSLRSTNRQAHHNANIQGTRNVLQAVATAGVRRIVHVSSVAVYAGHTPRVREDHPQYSDRSRHLPWRVYRISKALSEQLAWRLANEHHLELTTVRPCGIYGAFDPNFTAVYRRLVGSFLSFTPLMTRVPLVYAGDVAEAIALCLEKPVSIGEAYNVTGDVYELRPFVKAWPQAGGPIGRVRVPLPLPFRLSAFFDNDKAKRDLGWGNRPYVEALRDTFTRERDTA
jgi:nucleoside-diphosphate-sugar epimerase